EREDLQPFQVHPVELALRRWRQRGSGHEHLAPPQRLGGIAVVDIREPGHQTLGGLSRAHARELALAAAGVAQDPWLVAEDLRARLGEGIELDLTAHAEGADDPAQQDAPCGIAHAGSGRAWRGRGNQAAWAGASAAAFLDRKGVV